MCRYVSTSVYMGAYDPSMRVHVSVTMGRPFNLHETPPTHHPHPQPPPERHPNSSPGFIDGPRHATLKHVLRRAEVSGINSEDAMCMAEHGETYCSQHFPAVPLCKATTGEIYNWRCLPKRHLPQETYHRKDLQHEIPATEETYNRKDLQQETCLKRDLQ